MYTLKDYSVKEKKNAGKWLQKDWYQGRMYVWRLHYIEHNTEYVVGHFFSKREANEFYKRFKKNKM